MTSTINGGISFWYADDGIPAPREPLPGDATADVCIVGGGYTGLWTAYYLKKAVPFLNITVLEAKFCGYGASGRNGGWLYNGIAGRDRYARLHGHDAAVRLQQAMNDTVAEVVRIAAEENIDADIHQGGVLEVAHNPAQLDPPQGLPRRRNRLRREGPRTVRRPRDRRPRPRRRSRRLHLDPARRPSAPGETAQRTRDGRRGTRRHHPRIDPRHGDQAQTRDHPVRHGPRPLRPALHRRLHRVPQGPAPHLAPHELLHDRHGAPPRRRLGTRSAGTAAKPSATWPTPTCTPSAPPTTASPSAAAASPTATAPAPTTTARTQPATVDALRDILVRFFPPLAGTDITTPGPASSASPATGAPPSPSTARPASAGPAATSAPASPPPTSPPAPCATSSSRTPASPVPPTSPTLPWVNHKVRKWEPEPFRWLGVHTLYAAYRTADRQEFTAHTTRTSRIATLADRISGRH